MNTILNNCRLYLFFALFFCLVVFGYGFALIRIEGFLPITETVLIVLLLTMSWLKAGGFFVKNLKLLWPLWLWWILGFVHVLFDLPAHGIWALRDGSQLIESLFLIVAIFMAAMPHFLSKFKWLLVLTALAMFISMIVLFCPKCMLLAPYINQFAETSHGVHASVNLFFSWQTTAKWGFFLATVLLVFFSTRNIKFGWKVVLFVIATYMFWVSIFIFQQRSVYLEAILLLVWVGIYARCWLLPWLCVLGSFLLTHMLTMAKILIIGRISLPVALVTLAMHAGTIVHWVPKQVRYPTYQTQIHTALYVSKPVPVKSTPHQQVGHLDKAVVKTPVGKKSINQLQAHSDLKGASGGIGLRLGWWKHIWHQTIASWQGMLWGQGFGVPLTNFHTPDGIVVRNPHNALFNMMGRMGLLGLLAWVSVQLMFLYAACRLIVILRKRQLPLENTVFTALIGYFVIAIPNFLTEPFFIYPYFCVPYYFFGGVLLYMYLKLRGHGDDAVAVS